MYQQKPYQFFTSNELKPTGWLKEQLRLQANGLCGNLDKVWPDVRDSAWIGGTKDVDADRYIDMTSRRVTAYLKSGDPNIYYSNEGGTLDTVKKISIAGITSFNTIKYKTNVTNKITSLDQIKVMDGDRQLQILSLSTLNNNVNNGEITVANRNMLCLQHGDHLAFRVL